MIKGTPPRADSGNVIARLTRSLTASMAGPRQKKDRSSGDVSSVGRKMERSSGEQTPVGRSFSPPTSPGRSEAVSSDGFVSERNSDTVIDL